MSFWSKGKGRRTFGKDIQKSKSSKDTYKSNFHLKEDVLN